MGSKLELHSVLPPKNIPLLLLWKNKGPRTMYRYYEGKQTLGTELQKRST